jgi:hypothetical protein
MTVAYSVVSYYMPVRDGIHELSVSVILDKVLVTSIGPYWFLHYNVDLWIAVLCMFRNSFTQVNIR